MSLNKCKQEQDSKTVFVFLCNFTQQTTKAVKLCPRVQVHIVGVVFCCLQFSARLVTVQQVTSVLDALVEDLHVCCTDFFVYFHSATLLSFTQTKFNQQALHKSVSVQTETL